MILRKLNEMDGHTWRLPTKEEWLNFSHTSKEEWPWGNNPPEFNKHAHLDFMGQHHPNGPIEVGCFPNGTSPEGLTDLIGNVYELLEPEIIYQS